MKAGIRSIGWWVPKSRLYPKEIAREYELSEEVIHKIGLRSRPVAGVDDHPSTMGAKATHAALTAANLTADDLDYLIFAGVTRDFPTPWVAAYGVLHELGTTRTAGLDIASRCAGGIDAIWLAKTLIESGTYKNIAIVCSERFDYLLGPKDRPAQQPFDAMYSAGAAAMIISSNNIGNEIVAFSSFTNPDLSIHHSMGPIAGGTQMPLSREAIDDGLHLWHGQLSINDVSKIAKYSADADRYNYPRLFKKAGIDGADFIVCSPLDPAPQLAVLKELGVQADAAFFTVPFLGHIGPADLFLIMGVAIASGKNLGHRIILSTRTPVYSNAIAIIARNSSPEINVLGDGIDIGLWSSKENVA
jgi:3-oxoacyl-[acyl-carrier-protein] synthase III